MKRGLTRPLLRSVVWRTVIVAVAIGLGLALGSGDSLKATTATWNPTVALWIGVGLGLFLGFVGGTAFGIMRVLRRARAQGSIVFPGGTIEFHAHENQTAPRAGSVHGR